MTRTSRKSTRLLAVSLLVICMTAVLGQSLFATVSPDKLRVPDADKVQMITLRDGSMLTGRITEIRADSISFSSQVGEVTIAINQIEDIREVASSSIKGGKYWFPNPNRTRLYIAPTGRTLEAGQGYISDLLLFFPSAAYGLTDNITIGGGCSLFPGVDFDKQLWYLLPKVGISVTELVSIAGSALILRIPQFDQDLVEEPKVAGIVFGTCTIGTDDKSVTIGLGDGYVDDDFAEKPAFLIGGELRVARRLSLVSENWVFPEIDQPLISYGVRFFGESISADIGFFTPGGEDLFFPGIPLVSFAYNF
ncbi:MAG TPA: hypothetical protein VMY05_01120 [Acidobacteriota bacterium]|nr:hypothetical protein [Acidobacteriota bacterium]